MTDYHDLTTPEEGADDWHLPLNENFRTIDEKIEIRDEASAKSDYPPKAGAKYLATDTGEQWIGDGGEWNRLASTGESPEFDSISHRDRSGQLLQRECLLATAPDGEYISIPAEGDYDYYYIRLIFAVGKLRISFNDPPGETLARKTLIQEDSGTVVLEIYIFETESVADKNNVGTFGGGLPATYTLGNDPINEIYLDQTVRRVEAWGIRYE